MDLMPKVSKDFSSKKYWDGFFKKRKDTFEWYGNYIELAGLLHRYIKPKDVVLVPGCGNSKLSENLYDGGCQNITNIDISKQVIKKMAGANKKRNVMSWHTMSVNEMSFDENHFSAVIDKGTLDAMMSSEDCNIDLMLDEVSRCTKLGGRYLCLTLAQDHVLNKLLEYFPKNNWLLRVHRVWTSDDDNDVNCGAPKMPLFMFVMTKFAKPLSIYEICMRDDDKPQRLSSLDEVRESIKSQQYYAMLRNELQHKKSSTTAPVELYAAGSMSQPRYRIHVIDTEDVKRPSFGIFIIPQGQELEYTFATRQGRERIARQTGCGRLLMVELSRHHSYDDESGFNQMQLVQRELSAKVMQLKPNGLPNNYKTSFMSSCGSNLGTRTVRATFTANNIAYTIEDYVMNDVTYRRMTRDTTSSSSPLACVTSCMRLTTPSSDGDDGRVDKKYLRFESYQPIITYLMQFSDNDARHQRALFSHGCVDDVALMSHLTRYLPEHEIHVTCCDDVISDVAQKWYGVGAIKSFHQPSDEKFNVVFMNKQASSPIDQDELNKNIQLLDQQNGVLVLTVVQEDEDESQVASYKRVLESSFSSVKLYVVEETCRFVCLCTNLTTDNRKSPPQLNDDDLHDYDLQEICDKLNSL